jgi:hypothetical protein
LAILCYSEKALEASVSETRKPGRKEIYNRWHIASVAFPVNVAKATLAKQAYLCSVNLCNQN